MIVTVSGFADYGRRNLFAQAFFGLGNYVRYGEASRFCALFCLTHAAQTPFGRRDGCFAKWSFRDQSLGAVVGSHAHRAGDDCGDSFREQYLKGHCAIIWVRVPGRVGWMPQLWFDCTRTGGVAVAGVAWKPSAAVTANGTNDGIGVLRGVGRRPT